MFPRRFSRDVHQLSTIISGITNVSEMTGNVQLFGDEQYLNTTRPSEELQVYCSVTECNRSHDADQVTCSILPAFRAIERSANNVGRGSRDECVSDNRDYWDMLSTEANCTSVIFPDNVRYCSHDRQACCCQG